MKLLGEPTLGRTTELSPRLERFVDRGCNRFDLCGLCGIVQRSVFPYLYTVTQYH